MKKTVFALLIATLATTALMAQKFAYVDTKYILSHVPEYQAAQAEVNKLSTQWQKEIEAKYETIAKLEAALQAEKILLTDEMRKKREQEIEQKKQEAKDMQKAKFGVDGELFKKREELIKPIQDQIYEAIQDVASTSALMVVFDKANHSNMLYTNPKHDVSDKVLKKMGLKPGEVLEEEDGEGGEGDEDKGKEENPAGGKDKGGKTSPAPGNKGTERSPSKGK
ncbi:MAG: OmpH family outer membrane protein [Flavobacteriales bacterium]|nr:OmpH family outer membrane protein [Flavobacteriales bacterium]